MQEQFNPLQEAKNSFDAKLTRLIDTITTAGFPNQGAHAMHDHNAPWDLNKPCCKILVGDLVCARALAPMPGASLLTVYQPLPSLILSSRPHVLASCLRQLRESLWWFMVLLHSAH